MPRIRTVKPEFFKHYDLYLAEKESGLPLRLGFQGLWLCCDKQGAFKWQPEVLKLDILPYDQIDFKKVLNVLLTGKFIGRYLAADGKHYGIIPTLPEHQRFSGNEHSNPPIYPSPPDTYIFGSNEEALCSNPEALSRTGREEEGKGKERKGREEESSPEDIYDEFLIYDIEDYLLKNRSHFEVVCMSAGKSEKEVLPVLQKFHLWNQENEKYPKKPLALIAGLKKWLINEKKSTNGTNYTNTSKSSRQSKSLKKLMGGITGSPES